MLDEVNAVLLFKVLKFQFMSVIDLVVPDVKYATEFLRKFPKIEY